ncbi:MAG: nuclear transport factor 2 family protein [Actinomycetota bacterium]|nr:nuclear transport factor 2 family protein [Actinomycetota bacterium]
MSQENVKLAHEVIDAVKTQDASRLVELTDPGVEWYSLVSLGGSEGYRGHDGIRRYIEDIADALEFIYAEVDDAISVGELVLLVGHFHYRGKASGVDTKSPAGFVVRFRDGRVVYMRAFRDPEQALTVVGLSE